MRDVSGLRGGSPRAGQQAAPSRLPLAPLDRNGPQAGLDVGSRSGGGVGRWRGAMRQGRRGRCGPPATGFRRTAPSRLSPRPVGSRRRPLVPPVFAPHSSVRALAGSALQGAGRRPRTEAVSRGVGGSGRSSDTARLPRPGVRGRRTRRRRWASTAPAGAGSRRPGAVEGGGASLPDRRVPPSATRRGAPGGRSGAGLPSRSCGSLLTNRALMAAGPADRSRVILFPVDHRPDRPGTGLRGRGRLRPGTAREPGARPAHPVDRPPVTLHRPPREPDARPAQPSRTSCLSSGRRL